MSSPKLVGIVNVTPDSFSDGGQYFSPQAALAAIDKLIEEGADVIDIGAESTRPDAAPISPEEEWQRLSPVLAELKNSAVPISVDTRHAATARQALAAGAAWINDVSGYADPAMVAAVRDAGCMLVVMHSLSVPARRDVVLAEGADPVETLIDWADVRFAALEQAGIAPERLIFDPGIGFGKTPAQSLAILQNIRRLESLGVPLLVGHSRKSFLGDVDRDAATLEWSNILAGQGVEYLRVHDVCAHRSLFNGSR